MLFDHNSKKITTTHDGITVRDWDFDNGVSTINKKLINSDIPVVNTELFSITNGEWEKHSELISDIDLVVAVPSNAAMNLLKSILADAKKAKVDVGSLSNENVDQSHSLYDADFPSDKQILDNEYLEPVEDYALVYTENNNLLSITIDSNGVHLAANIKNNDSNEVKEEWIPVIKLIYSSDLSELILTYKNGETDLLDTTNSTVIQHIEGNNDFIISELILRNENGEIDLLGEDNSLIEDRINKNNDYITPDITSQDGSLVAFQTKNNEIKIQNIKTNDIRTLKTYDFDIAEMAFSPNNEIIAVSSFNTIRLINVETGEIIQSFEGHTIEGGSASVYALAFNPRNNNVLASASYNGTVEIWDLFTLELFHRYDPKQLSDALQFLWEMGLDRETSTFGKKVRKPSLLPNKGYYLAGAKKFYHLLRAPKPAKTKVGQLVQWLKTQCAYTNPNEVEKCCADKDPKELEMCGVNNTIQPNWFNSLTTTISSQLR